MRATRFCAWAQPPHRPENAVSANASAQLRLTGKIANRHSLPIGLLMERTSPLLSIA
jgi:hypothetical protein